MRVRVLFFGRLKDIVGRAEEEAELSEGARVEDLFARYGSRLAGSRKLAATVLRWSPPSTRNLPGGTRRYAVATRSPSYRLSAAAKELPSRRTCLSWCASRSGQVN